MTLFKVRIFPKGSKLENGVSSFDETTHITFNNKADAWKFAAEEQRLGNTVTIQGMTLNTLDGTYEMEIIK